MYCRRRKIRCLPPIGEGDRCQNCARQQRECVVQPIAGSTRKGGRNQANAISTEPMPYAEALSMTRQNNHSLAHRRQKQYPESTFYSPSIAVPPPYFGNQPLGMPLSAPAHFASVPFISTTHHATEQYSPDSSRRPQFKQMQSAPGTLYTLHHGGFDRSSTHETFPGQWQPNPAHPHYTAVPPQDTFHPPGQEMSADTNNPFWKLSVTSPTASDASLPPPRPQNQWVPNGNSNYTHERPTSSVTLPAPSNAFADSQTFPTQTQYFNPAMPAPGPVAFQNSPHGSTGSSQPHEEHCEGASQWSRSTVTTGCRAGGSN